MAQSRTVKISNKRGLHARASNAFSRLAQTYDCEVFVSREGLSADARSIMELLSLAAGKGSQIEIIADGPDEVIAIGKLVEFVEERFGEED